MLFLLAPQCACRGLRGSLRKPLTHCVTAFPAGVAKTLAASMCQSPTIRLSLRLSTTRLSLSQLWASIQVKHQPTTRARSVNGFLDASAQVALQFDAIRWRDWRPIKLTAQCAAATVTGVGEDTCLLLLSYKAFTS